MNINLDFCEINSRNTIGMLGLPGGSVVKNLPANAGDTGDSGSVLGLVQSVSLLGRLHG